MDSEKECVPSKLELSALQRDVLHGCLLGDAALEWSAQRLTARIKFEQSAKHADYLFHLYEVFRPFVSMEPKHRVRKCSTGVDCESYCFQTIKHRCFRFYGHQYSPDGQKIVPRLMPRWLTPRVFSYWFMDDGSIKSREGKGVLLNTQGFERVDVMRLVEAIEMRLQLAASIRRQNDGFQIYISGKSYDRLVEIVEPWLIDSMRYKLPPPRRTRMPKK